MVYTYNDQSFVPPEYKPLARTRTHWDSSSNDAYYTYAVHGKEYPAVLSGGPGPPPQHVTVYYDPQYPQTYTFGPIMPPWLIMLFACGIAAFLCFVGYQFRGSLTAAQTPTLEGKSAE